jgi:Glyoxalase/Bleomycin resistance protein/Dioxygenase superfamily
MTQFGLIFHHLGLAVRQAETALTFVRGMGYAVQDPVFDPLQNVNLIMCTHAVEPAIEIIYKAQGDAPIDPLLAKHPKGLIYHCCYVSRDVVKSIDALAASDLRAVCVSPPKPAVLFGGLPVSFYQIAGIGLIEIIEEPAA